MFEYEDGLLIVDALYWHPSYTNGNIVKINDVFYRIHNTAMKSKPIKETALKPCKKIVDESFAMTANYEYLNHFMIPRGGFDVRVDRPITAEEFEELCKKYNLTDDEVSEVFEDKIGSIYGKYAVVIKSLQIKVPTAQDAFTVTRYLREKGIQAGTGSANRVDIRADWGGYREGAGRKSTGRHLARIYVTDEEEQKLRNYLKQIREK